MGKYHSELLMLFNLAFLMKCKYYRKSTTVLTVNLLDLYYSFVSLSLETESALQKQQILFIWYTTGGPQALWVTRVSQTCMDGPS